MSPRAIKVCNLALDNRLQILKKMQTKKLQTFTDNVKKCDIWSWFHFTNLEVVDDWFFRNFPFTWYWSFTPTKHWQIFMDLLLFSWLQSSPLRQMVGLFKNDDYFIYSSQMVTHFLKRQVVWLKKFSPHQTSFKKFPFHTCFAKRFTHYKIIALQIHR